MGVMKCPSCRSTLTVRESIGTESLVCPGCEAWVGIASAAPRLIAGTRPRAARTPSTTPLALGAKGVLRGKTLEVTGILQRAEGSYTWFECAVADEKGDITWLWVDRGHFSWSVCEGKQCVRTVPGGEFQYGNETLKLFGIGKARQVWASGSFPFELDPSERSRIEDYIAPPFTASREGGVWWVFEYIPVEEIEDAFGVSCPEPVGIGMNQPSTYRRQRMAIGQVTVLALVALMLIHLFVGGDARQAPLLDSNVELRRPSGDPPQSLPGFALHKAWTAIEVDIRAPVSNAWADLNLAFVHAETGKSYWTSQGVEYYSGQDTDGGWTEGSPDRSVLIRSLPAGTYSVLASGGTGGWAGGTTPQYAQLQVYEKPAPATNLLLAFGIVLGLAGIFVWTGYRFEARRWEYSDYGPRE